MPGSHNPDTLTATPAAALSSRSSGFRATRASSLGFSSEALANVGNVLAPLVLIAAFIERAVEVLLTPVRGDQTDMLRHKIEDAKQAGSDTAQLERRLAEYKLGTRRQAFFLAVAIGLLASVLGVRGLEGLLETAPARGSSLQFFDVVLTGVVLGGGADGIHKPIQAFTDYMERVSKNAKASP